MKKYFIVISIFLVLMMFSNLSFSAPGISITKPPVMGPSNTGPLIDPSSIQGQWFKNLHTGLEEYRQFEFYDNVTQSGGGWRSSFAIEGYITQINFDESQNMTDFYMSVTITNDMPTATPWIYGINSHYEYCLFNTIEDQVGEITMRRVKWTASFADDSVQSNFPLGVHPYIFAQPPFDWDGSLESNIYAMPFSEDPEFGYDQLAWYCWAPDPANPNPINDGQYMVPTWDFGDVLPGQSVTRVVHFYLYMPVWPGHPLNDLLWTAYSNQWDMLMNRSTSLKVSEYFDLFFPDSGIQYPTEPNAGSDCSVFFDIESQELPIIDDVYRDHTNNGSIVLVFENMQSGLTYGIESAVMPYDMNYNETAMTWAIEWTGPMISSWTDPNCPPSVGSEKYYRLFMQDSFGGKIYCPDTVGAMSISCSVGRNLVSTPFVPYPDGGLSGGGIMGVASLNKIVGPQLTGHNLNKALSDNIEKWVNALGIYQRAWFKTMPAPGAWMDWNAGAPLFGIDADGGYWFNIISGHPAKIVTFCGRVSKVNRLVPINVGRNLVGSCFPVACPLSQSNLVGSGFTGHNLNKALSDNVEFWNNPAGAYERFWYKTSPAPGNWQPWNVGQPMRTIIMGDAIWVNVISGHAAFTWNYLVPPRPAFAP